MRTTEQTWIHVSLVSCDQTARAVVCQASVDGEGDSGFRLSDRGQLARHTELPPTLAFLKGRRAGALPTDEAIAKVRRYLWMEVAPFPRLPPFAAAMACSYSVFRWTISGRVEACSTSFPSLTCGAILSGIAHLCV
jgi:hypothetical protein